MGRRARVPSELISDAVLVQLCEGWIEEGWSADDAADWLRDQTPRIDVGRTRVFALLGEARRRGLIRLQVRSSPGLQTRLSERLDVPADRIRVVDAAGPAAAEQVARHGAEVTLDLIRALAAATDYDRIGVGLGGGHTLRRVSRHLADLLQRAGDRPALAIHALSSGFDPCAPQYAPVTFLGAFEPVADELVGLFSGVFEEAQARRMRDLPGVRESFRLARKIDVVVTSLASARDHAGALNLFLAHGDHPELAESRQRLQALGWVGDVLYEPYGDDGPIDAALQVRPVSVLDLADLRRRARSDDKAVVLVAGPSESGRSKADALLPLLTRPRLRVWSHLVVDAPTAEQVLQEI